MPVFSVPFTSVNPAQAEQSDPFYADGGPPTDGEGLPTHFAPVYSLVEAGIAGYSSNTITSWSITADFIVEREEDNEEGVTDTSEYNVAAFGISVDGSATQYLVNNGDSANFSVGNGVVNIEQIDRQQNTADGSAFQKIRITPVSSPFNSTWSYLQNSASNTAVEDTVSLFSNFPEANTYVGLTAWTEPNPDTYNVEYSFEMQYDGVAETISTLSNTNILEAPDPDLLDFFGDGIAANANSSSFAILARGWDASGTSNVGAVYFYNDSAELVAQYTETEGTFPTSLRMGGGFIFYGLPTFNTNSGCVRVFDYSGNLLTTIENPDLPGVNDRFGDNITFDENSNLLLIASSGDDDGGTNFGSVYVFEYDTNTVSTFNQLFKINAPNSKRYWGWNPGADPMAVGSGRIVIGQPRHDVAFGPSRSGQALVYDTNGSLIATLPPPSPSGTDYQFGLCIAIAGNKIFVGSRGNGTVPSQIFVYDLNGNLDFTISHPQSGSLSTSGTLEFGASFVIGNERLIVGHRNDFINSGVTSAGAIFVYDLDGNLLNTITEDYNGPGAGDELGERVGITSNKILGYLPLPDGPSGTERPGLVALYDYQGNDINIGTEETVITDDTFVKTINIEKNYYFQYTPYISAVPAVVEQGQR